MLATLCYRKQVSETSCGKKMSTEACVTRHTHENYEYRKIRVIFLLHPDTCLVWLHDIVFLGGVSEIEIAFSFR